MRRRSTPSSIGLAVAAFLLCGHLAVQAGEAPEMADVAFRFARSYSPMIVALLCVAVAVAGWWSMRREAEYLSKPLYWTLIALRVLPFILLIFLLLKPVLVYRTQSSLRQRVAVLVDESESMSVVDKALSRVQLAGAARILNLRQEPSEWPIPAEAAVIPSPADERAFQTALGLSDAEVQKIKETPRAELVRRAFAAREDTWETLREDYLLNLYSFSSELHEVPLTAAQSLPEAVTDLATTGASTRLGTSLQRIVQDLRGQPVAGLVVVSDGRNVAGIPPDIAAEIAADARIPIYAVPVGSGGSRDIAVTALIAESVVFKDDEFPVSAKLTSRGYDGFSVPVIFEIDGIETDRQTIRLTGGDQLVTFHHKHDAEARLEVAVRIAPQQAEESAENNVADTAIRIVDKKIKVLLVEEIPRWDFRYLRNMLERDDHVEVKIFLQQADREVALGDPLYLETLPATEKDLFEFDLIILGGLRPRFMTEEQMQLIEQFVSKMGGGLVLLAVENVSPELLAGTPLEPLLPVRLTRDARPWLNPDRLEYHGTERRLRLTSEGEAHSLVALEPETDRNTLAWQDFPPHFWIAESGGLKPAAQVLVESVIGREQTGLPAIVVQPYGLGRVLYVGSDSTWRWRYKVGDRYFVRFWTQAVQYMTLSRLLGQNKRLQVMTDRERYEAGEMVSLSVRALDPSFRPRTDEEISLTVEDDTGRAYEVRGYLEPDREGVYTAVFKIPYEGDFTVTVQDDAESAQTQFTAEQARLELRRPEADWAALARIAELSGGRIVPLDRLDELPDLLDKSRAQFTNRRERALWDWWPFLLAFVAGRTLELSLRKWKHLK